MTSEDHLLDPNLLLNGKPLVLYRLARAKYANLSGVGAAKYPGRWNIADQEAIYTSMNQSTTILERLVHTSKRLIPVDYSLMTIALTGNWLLSLTSLLRSNRKQRFSSIEACSKREM